MTNLILCGGVGERLWPISRTRYPKQFARLIEGQSLLQHTALRNRVACDKTLVVTNTEQYFMARDQLEELNLEARFVLESVGRNTAPAIALACLTLPPGELVLVTPSDHLIRNQEAYVAAMAQGETLAANGGIVTFGIKPLWAETGYGYIHADGTQVLAFKEKPDAETAARYLLEGNYLWNSGIFLFRCDVFLEELGKWRPDVLSACQAALAAETSMDNVETGSDFIRVREQAMLDIPRVSVDYAVMEKSERICVVPADINWSDLGSFESLYDALPQDAHGNTVINLSEGVENKDGFIGIGAERNFIYTESKRVAAIDVSDLMIVDTRDALLVGRRDSSQKVREVVELLKAEGSRLKDFHVTEYRPWGHYTALQTGEGFRIRTMTIKPGKWLGNHKHHYRNEHWVVVNGTAEIRVGEEILVISENQSTYIPSGLMHRIGNPGQHPLVMVEVQSGSHLDEGDIVRKDS